MSMQLYCEYEETFISKTGKELKYVANLRLYNTPGQSLAYILLCHTKDEQSFKKTFGRDKYNSEIFSDYLDWLKEYYTEIESPTYKYDYEDSIAIALHNKTSEECTPVSSSNDFIDHVKDCEKFFEKYGGIDNCNFFVA